MKPDWRRAKEVFAEVLDLPEGERTAAANARCGGDALLRETVARLVAAHCRATGLLNAPADGAGTKTPTSAATQPEAPAPARIGAFQVVRRLGAGGFGVVYQARQSEPVERDVAIKVLRGDFEDQGAQARFLAEQRALARMQHPNIARLLEVGAMEDGAPYVAMELVNGESIVRFCDAQGFTVRDRLGLFVDVCRGVHHAHQQAVIHCDLKPTNILVTRVDGHATPKVIDFGIARRAQGGAATPFELSPPLGTPRYMSPEQFRADAAPDIRIDVFALGVVLCELMTGQTPYSSTVPLTAPTPTMATPPSGLLARRAESKALASRLRGDLDAIVMKAVAWSPEERYESAAALADDVERHLRDEPVTAAPATRRYRLGKLIRRHRRAAVATAVSALALLAGATASTIGMLMAVQARDVARSAEADARYEALRSERMLDFLLDDMITAAEPAVAQGEEVTIVDLLADASAFAETRFADDPQTQLRILARIGRAYSALSRPEPAEAVLRRALELAESDTTVTAAGLVSLRLELARVLFQRGQHAEAMVIRAKAQAETEERLGATHPLALDARRVALRGHVDADVAELELREIVAELERQGLTQSEHYVLAIDQLAESLTNQGKSALTLQRKVSEISAHLYPPKHPNRLMARQREIKALSNALEHEAACDLMEQLLADATEVYRGALTPLATYRYEAIMVLLNAGRNNAALRIAQDHCDATADEFGFDSVPYATAAQYLGRALVACGRAGEGVGVLEESHRARARQWGAESPQAIGAGIEYARALLAVGAADHAAELLEDSRTAASVSPQSKAIAELLLALCWDALGRHAEADTLVQEVAERTIQASRRRAPWVRVVFARIAEYYRACGSDEEAAHYERLASSGE